MALFVTALLLPALPAYAARPLMDDIANQVVNGGYATTPGLAQHTTRFDVTWVDPDPGDTHRVEVNWGDGTDTQVHDPASSPFTVEHTYAGPGRYLASIRVTDSTFAFDQRQVKIYVADLSSGATTKFYGSAFESSNRFGQAVDLEGNLAVVGEPNGGTNGRVHVYRSSDGQHWVLEQALQPTTTNTGIGFGTAVDVDGTTLAVGARADYRPDGARTGGVYLFELGDAGWALSQVLYPDLDGSDDFGLSLALDGDRLVVGDPGRSVGEEWNHGAVTFYERGPDGTWSQSRVVTSPTANAFDAFGIAVDLSGEDVAVGAPGHITNEGNPDGLVYLYRWPTGDLPQDSPAVAAGPETDPDQSGSTRFGASLRLSGDGLLVVGVPGHYISSESRGAIHVLAKGPGNLDTVQVLPAAAGQFSLGEAVDIDNGLIVAHLLGDRGRDIAVFRQASPTSWTHTQTISPDPGGQNVLNNATNRRVAISGERILSGQDQDNDFSSSDGAALLFDVPAPTTRPLAVVLTRVADLSTGFDPADGSDASGPETTGDFFLNVNVFAGSFSVNLHNRDEHLVDEAIAEPYFVVATEVSEETATVVVSVLDADNGDGVSFDVADVNPDPDETDLVLEVDMATGAWSGDLTSPESCSRGDDPARAVEICFALSTLSPDADLDGDALLDSWELFGFDGQAGEGGIEDLPGWGADPRRMDLFVELDCLVDDGNGNGYSASDPQDHSHCPLRDAMEAIAQTFANGDVENLDGTTGVQLHIDVGTLYGPGFEKAVVGAGGAIATFGDLGGGNTIPEDGNETIVFENEDGETAEATVPLTKFGDLKAANFDAARHPVFRYSLWGHQTAFRDFDGTDSTSGLAERFCSDGCPTPGRIADDHLVTLGGPGWGKDANGFPVGTWQQQAGTFIHEFAHNLGLAHGGIDEQNRKPNHRSVLNYMKVGGKAMQFCNVTTDASGPATCDLSREELPPLDESSFDECLGFDSGGPLGPIDANGSKSLEGDTCGNGTANYAIDFDDDGNTTDVMQGSDDWSNLHLDYRGHAVKYGQSVFESGPTPELLDEAAEHFDSMSKPQITLEIPQSLEVEEGQELVVNVDLTNEGQGPAEYVQLSMTAPDATVLDAATTLLTRGDSTSLTLRWTAPANSAGTYTTEVVATYAGLSFLPHEVRRAVEIVVTTNGGPNSIPVANDDAYTTDEDTPLVVAAPGVLANDADVDGDVLTAVWVSGPGHGTLSLAADGSFTYTPGADFHGTDSFTYRASDGELASDTATVTITVVPVNDAPVVVSVSPDAQTVDHSDGIVPVTVTARDVDGDPLTLAASGLPDGVTASSATCTDPGVVPSQCTWTLSGVVTSPVGVFTGTATISDGELSDAATVAVTVEAEDATVFPDGANPVAVQVAEAGGASGTFTLSAVVGELVPDQAAGTAAAGELSTAVVSMTLAPVGPGSTVGPLTCTNGPVDGTGYDQQLAASCEFSDVPVNTYTVEIFVDGGYWSGAGEDVLTVSDPSLGSATGGGTFYWPDTADPETGYPGDRTSFGFTMSYNKKGTNLRGSLLVIRHLPDGTKFRVRSNALDGLALGEDPTVPMGWASFSGKATYLQPGWDEPEGNHAFTVYVEDRGDPGIGTDRFWLTTRDKDGHTIDAFSLADPAADHAQSLTGGNIVVPHKQARKR